MTNYEKISIKLEIFFYVIYLQYRINYYILDMGIKKGPNTTFPDNWKEIMINLGKQGKSNLQLFNMLDIGHSTHFKLLRNNPEYAYVYQLYLLEHETYWITLAKTSIENNSEFDNQLFFLTMGNKHRNKWNRKK